MNYSPWMTQSLVKQGIFQDTPLCIVDVGASGGIATYWDIFRPHLKAFGFEPLLAECERLIRAKSGDVNYYPYFVGSDDPDVQAESGPIYSSRLFSRTSAFQATQLKQINYISSFFNQGKEAIYADQKISIDRFFDQHSVDTIDFLKVDTDGYDYEVLHGAKSVLVNHQVLGLTVEAQFYGGSSHHSNTFRNIDRLLTDLGYSLFDLQVYRYTKADLPGRFSYRIPAQTETGQVLWGEAVYFKDVTMNRGSVVINPIKLIKLACLYELHNLADCSAELLKAYRDELAPFMDVDQCLDLLVRNTGVTQKYNDYIRKFEDNFEGFYPTTQSVILKKVRKFFGLNLAGKKDALLSLLRRIH